MRILTRLMAAILFSALPGFAQASNWQIDPAHSAAQFAIRHLAVSTVRGEFTKISGHAQLDEKDITKSQIEVTVETATLNTRVDGRDNDVKGPNYLDVTKFPIMTFKSKSITHAGDGKLKLTGDLTLHGVTKEVTFDVVSLSEAIKDPWGNTRRGAEATAKINRQDFGVQGGGLAVGNDVNITIDMELIKKG